MSGILNTLLTTFNTLLQTDFSQSCDISSTRLIKSFQKILKSCQEKLWNYTVLQLYVTQ